MWGVGNGPIHKRDLWLHLKLARVEEDLSVSVSVDYVACLLDIERTRPTMRMDWFFAVWWDRHLQHSHMLILEDDLVIFRCRFHRIHVFRPRACLLGAIRCGLALGSWSGHEYRDENR